MWLKLEITYPTSSNLSSYTFSEMSTLFSTSDFVFSIDICLLRELSLEKINITSSHNSITRLCELRLIFMRALLQKCVSFMKAKWILKIPQMSCQSTNFKTDFPSFIDKNQRVNSRYALPHTIILLILIFCSSLYYLSFRDTRVFRKIDPLFVLNEPVRCILFFFRN